MAKENIMIVEDEIIVARDIQSRLEKMGYSVPVVATSGEEAIKKAAEMHPDLVLMDIKLGGDVDGIDASKQIYSHFNYILKVMIMQLKIIYQTHILVKLMRNFVINKMHIYKCKKYVVSTNRALMKLIVYKVK